MISQLTPAQAKALLHDWTFWARPKQLPPAGEWSKWVILAGRGFGKTRTGAETVRWAVDHGYRRIALVGRTTADVRDVMIEGESGLLACYPDSTRPVYQPSLRRVMFKNGAIATTYSGDEPDQLRGPQHDFAWGDEVAAWKKPAALDNLLMGLRLGDDPKGMFTTTPRKVKHLRELLAMEGVILTTGTTYENRAHLAPGFFKDMIRRYEGTSLGRQELEAVLLEDNEGALWRRAWIDDKRLTRSPALLRIIVAVDPSASSGENAAECGIIVAGLGEDGRLYVVDDVSVRGTPNEWGAAAVTAYHKFEADSIIAEANQGGEMVSEVFKSIDRSVPVKLVHASRGKQARAEPVSSLYQQGRVSHVGSYAELEDQLCNWVPGQTSPDRLDALVWAATALMLPQTTPPPKVVRARGIYGR